MEEVQCNYKEIKPSLSIFNKQGGLHEVVDLEGLSYE
eukprot:SAG31_NODE_45542_length_258_cov_0.962264_1_plen_36_part_10